MARLATRSSSALDGSRDGPVLADQVEDARHPGQDEQAAGQDRAGDVDGDPVGVQRGHDRARRRAEHLDREPSPGRR